MARKKDSVAPGQNALNTPYGGYFQREVPGPDPELTSTDPGTPMGEFMRRYWQPVCLSEKIDELPQPIRIMGEDLVAFRDLGGRVGVMHRHCSHRGASLEFGLPQEKGIRCCYHGWWYDIDGTILEMPEEPDDSPIKDKLCHGAYPAIERHGLVFAYMGPPDLKPDFHVYDSIDVPDNKIYAFSNWLPCNWLQVHENVADQAHISVFHNGVGSRALMEGAGADSTETSLPKAFSAESPVVENRVTDNGRTMVIITTRRVGDRVWVRNNHFMVPNYLEIAGVFEDLESQKYFAGASHVRWNVPHDDDSCSVFAWRYFNKESEPKGKGDSSKLGVEGGDFLEGLTGARPREERHRYPGDWDVLVGQRAIAVHAKENLAASDQGVAMWRKICRDALRDETQHHWAKPGNGGEAHFRGYVNDTVFFIPPLVDPAEDRDLLRDVGRRVTDIITDESLSPGRERKDEVRKRLQAFENEVCEAHGS